jgi:predicted acylesterase/phospholipase RssA
MTTTFVGPHSAPTLTCDIVMKGGIASGVIYPRAVAELARTYRLSHVGGASAGAIAAAAAAAAELGRSTGGFEELDRMPDDLAAPGPDGRSTLASFFQPTRNAAPLFRLLLTVAEARNKLGAAVGGLLRAFWKEALLGALPGLVLLVLSGFGEGIASASGAVGGVLVLLVGVALGLAWGALRTLAHVAGDGFGMCTGMAGVDHADAEPLTPWLHRKLQSLAGRGGDSPPLTFGDLRRAGVTLRMMTTNLTRHQPMAMPWSTDEFFFDPAEMRTLFPADVVDWMVAHPPPGGDEVAGAFATRLHRAQAGPLRPWPAADDLPVIVATRMSLSFPALITAVRLYAIDFTQPSNWEASEAGAAWHRANPEGTVDEALAALPAPRFSSVWFTDGGLCANLPVHFFDTPLPKHPTFAFNLGPFPPGTQKSTQESENSFLPTTNLGGLQRPWFPLPTRGLGSWASFGLLMVHTAREWVDGAQLVMPGYRDRIVTVHHDAEEGGMNLSMPPEVVRALAERGRLGAVKLVTQFAGAHPGIHPAWGWDNHRWVRFRTATSGLSRWLRAFTDSYHDGANGGTPYPDLAGSGADAELPSYKLTKTERETINDRTHDVVEMVDGWVTDLRASTPRPAPRLRLVPDDGTASGFDEQAGG